MFLLHSIIGCGVLEGEAHNTKALIFSVKSEDLMFLDYGNSRLTPAQREQYAALGLPAEPFGNVFADAEDERAQYTMLIGQVAARLRRDVIPAGPDGAIRIGGVDPDHDKILRSFGDLVTLLEAELGDDSTRASWVAGSAVTGSVNALLLRLRSAVRPLSAERALRRARPPAPVPGDPRPLPELLFRLSAGRRFRRAGQRPVRADRHGRAGGARRRPAGNGCLGDLTAILLPPLASAPHKDLRAPQSLVPIGGLERQLRHRLGDQHILYRALRAAAMPVR
jgi:hypothetical protein